ncbi:Ty-3/Gypsy retrotransposon polyprotein, partial [Trifolium medium]|nr:Ty-3/Gypsy retrotransposon polyprotein [Trifolium medium]
MSSSYHPQTDGQTEVTNRVVEQYLRAFVHVKPTNWYRYLPWAELHFNTSYHSASGLTPYQVVYGKPPPQITDYIAGTSMVEACDKVLSTRDEILALLRKNLLKAQSRMKEIADKKRRDVVYEIGSWVYVKLRPHRQTSLS